MSDSTAAAWCGRLPRRRGRLQSGRAGCGRRVRGGLVPGNAADLPALRRAGVLGFKAFPADSGVPEFPPVDGAGLAAGMRTVDALSVVHAEDPEHLRAAAGSPAYADFLASRPPAAEHAAVATARATGARVHILHLSAASALAPIAAARAEGVLVTAETCPPYLTPDADRIPDGATTCGSGCAGTPEQRSARAVQPMRPVPAVRDAVR